MKTTLFAIGLLGATLPAMAADPATIDWGKIPAATVPQFYPGQSSFEWLRNDHKKSKGAKAVENGQACVRCHEGEEKKLGASLVKGGPLESTPVKGKPGHVDLKVQAAYDERNAYLRFQWRTNAERAGKELRQQHGDQRAVHELRRHGVEAAFLEALANLLELRDALALRLVQRTQALGLLVDAR